MKNNRFRSPSGILGDAVLLFVGLLLLLKPDVGSAAIAAIIGWGLVIIAALGVCLCIASWPICGMPELGLSIGGVLFGIVLLVRPLALSTILGLGLGVILIFQGVKQLRTFRTLRQLGLSAYPQLIFAIVTLILAVILLVVPMTASRVVISTCAVAMILYAIVNLIYQLRRHDHEPEDPNIIDADE